MLRIVSFIHFGRIENTTYFLRFTDLWGQFNNYVDKGGGDQKLSVFAHAQGIKTIHTGGGGSENDKMLST